MKNQKKNILLVGDMPGWAFDNIIDFVRTKLKGSYNFYYDFTTYNPRNNPLAASDSKNLIIDKNLINQYKRNYYVYRIPFLKKIAYKFISNLNKKGYFTRDAEGKKRRIRKDNKYDCAVFLDFYMNVDGDFDSLVTEKIIKGIYTDGFPPKGIILEEISLELFSNNFLSDSYSLIAGSNSICKIYKNVFPGDIYVANLAYNEHIFKPKDSLKNLWSISRRVN